MKSQLKISQGGLVLKIAFWSNASETCGVSGNMAAISVASVIRYPYSVIAMENHLCSRNLGKAFLGQSFTNQINEVGTNYYDGGGVEGLMRKIYRGELHSDMLKLYLKEVIKEHLYYIPQSRVIHNEIFDYEFNHCIHPLISLLEEHADLCYMDAASHNNLSTKTILEEADLIVVNLCQKQSILEDFFLNYSSLSTKAVYIIGNYIPNTKLGIKNISSHYEIPLERIIAIPQNEGYENAYSNGSVVEFILRNYNCQNDSQHFYFIQALKKATYVIIRRAVELAREKENHMCLH